MTPATVAYIVAVPAVAVAMVEVEIVAQIDRIDCQTGEQFAFHIHAHHARRVLRHLAAAAQPPPGRTRARAP
jgi:hypothetical protein